MLSPSRPPIEYSPRMLFISQYASYAGSERRIVVKPYAMSACALFIIGMTRMRRSRDGGTGGETGSAGSAALPDENARLADSRAPAGPPRPTPTNAREAGPDPAPRDR